MIFHKYSKNNIDNQCDLTHYIKPQIFINKENKKSVIFQEIQALTKRLYQQVIRRPSTFFISIIQPLLWLLLFGSLFQNMPINLFTSNIKYYTFLTPGIIIFTSFNGSIYGGLPLIFDREFGFLNRLVTSPILFKESLLIAILIYITTTTILQTFTIIICDKFIIQNSTYVTNLNIIISIITLITISVASFSISLAFILPGHIEFLAILLLINLPILFASTALAPLSFMPYWLQIIACLNPLTYAIEILRYINMSDVINYKYEIIKTVWFSYNILQCIFIIISITGFSFLIAKSIIKHKYE